MLDYPRRVLSQREWVRARRNGVPVLALVLTACGPGEPSTAATADTETPDEVPVSVPLWSGPEALAALDAALSSPFPTPRDVGRIYVDYLSHAEGSCPGMDPGTIDMLTGCTTSEGYYYAGIAGFSQVRRTDESGIEIDQCVLSGDLEMFDAGGSRFAIGGVVNDVMITLTDGGVHYEAEYAGTIVYTGPDSPVSGGISALLEISHLSQGGKDTLDIDGGIGTVNAQLAFDAAQFGSPACPEGFTGAFQIRDPDGHWYVLDYGDACTGCGSLTADGVTDLGEQCFDATAFEQALTAKLHAL